MWWLVLALLALIVVVVAWYLWSRRKKRAYFISTLTGRQPASCIVMRSPYPYDYVFVPSHYRGDKREKGGENECCGSSTRS